MMDLPGSNANYKVQEYWDERFSKEDSFEWCKSYCDFKDLVAEHVRKSDMILMMGCGNSRLSEDMYNDGYRNITNIDFSPVVIENMRRRCEDVTDMQWMVMDILKLTFDRSSFDVVMEKATLDALLVEEADPWSPSEDAWNTMDCVLSQVSKILKTGGRFISMTFSQPHFRKPFLAKLKYDWSISLCTYGDSFHFFFYVMEKGQQLSKEDKVLGMTVTNKEKYAKDHKGREQMLCGLIGEDSEDFLTNITL